MDQLTPEKKFNSNLEEEGKKGEEALSILFRSKYNSMESSCFNYSFFFLIIMQVGYHYHLTSM